MTTSALTGQPTRPKHLPSADLVNELTNSLWERYSLPISLTYLTTFLSKTRTPFPPTPALLSTLHFRLLASDITTSLSQDPSILLPNDIGDPNTKELRLTAAIPCQILDAVDVGSSRYSQIETLEQIERGEATKGREIIRTVDVEGAAETGVPSTAATVTATSATNASTGGSKSQGLFRYTLQDACGTQVAAFSVSPIPKLMPAEQSLSIGCKILLKPGTLVRRGVAMIQSRDVEVLGGKVEAWDRKWRESRKARLVAEMTAATTAAEQGA